MGSLSAIQAETIANAVTSIRMQKRTIVFECTGNDAGREVKNIIVAVFAPVNTNKLGVPGGSIVAGGANQGWEKFSATFKTKDAAQACLTEISDAITALFSGGNGNGGNGPTIKPYTGGNDETPLQSGNGETPLQPGSGSGGGSHYTSHGSGSGSQHATATKAKQTDYTTPVVLGAAAIIIVLLLDF